MLTWSDARDFLVRVLESETCPRGKCTNQVNSHFNHAKKKNKAWKSASKIRVGEILRWALEKKKSKWEAALRPYAAFADPIVIPMTTPRIRARVKADLCVSPPKGSDEMLHAHQRLQLETEALRRDVAAWQAIVDLLVLRKVVKSETAARNARARRSSRK
jgi:hypothetical protein